MKVRKAIKRIMALSTGAAMLGATMFGAMAADLNQYPTQFIKDGVFDGLLVVGDNAAAEDIIGVTNIATSLQAASVKKQVVETSGTTVSVEGDAKKIGTSSNFLELGENLDAAGMTTVDSNDLTALKDGNFQNNRGTYKYTQSISLPKANVQYAKDSDLSDNYELYLKFNSSKTAYEYKMAFTPAMESEVDSSSNLKDFRDKPIAILGKDYTILTAKNESNKITLTLFSGAMTDILTEGSTKSYTLKSKDYTVTASYISSSEAMFTVNGQTTDKLLEGETYRLTDGTEIGVRDVLAQQYAGDATGGDKVQFSLGAQKIKIIDNDPGTSTYDSGNTVTVGQDDLANIKTDIVYSYSSGIAKISGLNFKYSPSTTLYVPVNGKLSTIADDKEGDAGNVIFGGFDIEYKGLTTGNTETVKVEPDGSNKYSLSFENRNGDEYNVPIWGQGASVQYLGDYDGSTLKTLVTLENNSISKDDMFILSPSATQKSHIFQFKSVNTVDKTFKIRDLASGAGTIESNNATTFTVDGTTFWAYYDGTSDAPTLHVDLNGDGDSTVASLSGTNNNETSTVIYTKYSGDLAYLNLTNTTHAYLKTPKNENMPSTDAQETIAWDIQWDTTNLKAKLQSSVESNFGSFADMNKMDSKDVYNGYTYYGVYGTYDYTNSDQPTLTLVVPQNQAQALVYVTSGATTDSSSTTGGLVTEVVQKIDVGAVKLASEVTSSAGSNLILVGGPCANSVARQVMGVTQANCAEGFEAGKAMIKLYEHAPGKVAMVVAGFNAVDTRRAAQVVANYKDYTTSLNGAEVEVTTVTSTPTVAAPMPKTTTVVEETTTTTTTTTTGDETTGTQ